MAPLRLALGAGGLAVLLGASLSPLAELGEERLFTAHMIQHLLLGDIAPLLIALAVGSLVPSSHPLAALLAWAGALGVWHLPRLYDLALRNEGVHQLQHLSFFVAGFLLWSAVLRGQASLGWRIGAVVGVGLAGTALGHLFLWASEVVYKPYASAPRAWGLSPLADQELGGALMLAEGAAVTIAVFAWLVLPSLAEGEDPR